MMSSDYPDSPKGCCFACSSEAYTLHLVTIFVNHSESSHLFFRSLMAHKRITFQVWRTFIHKCSAPSGLLGGEKLKISPLQVVIALKWWQHANYLSFVITHCLPFCQSDFSNGNLSSMWRMSTHLIEHLLKM